MFSTSTQAKTWVFPDEHVIEGLRWEANAHFARDNPYKVAVSLNSLGPQMLQTHVFEVLFERNAVHFIIPSALKHFLHFSYHLILMFAANVWHT